MIARTLYVPANVSLRNEVWRGLSVGDAVRCLRNAAIVAAFCVALRFMLNVEVLWCILAALIAAALSVTVYQRLESNLSMIEYIRIAIKFYKEQKRYLYVYRRQNG